MRALLDVNVLLALLDRDHVGHVDVRSWMMREGHHGWASCALTQNGFVRVISQPRYPRPVHPRHAIERLARATSTEHHEFWPCAISVLDPTTVDRTRLLAPGQVTDVYLLALAASHRARFVTFDRSVPLAAAPGADEQHLVLL